MSAKQLSIILWVVGSGLCLIGLFAKEFSVILWVTGIGLLIGNLVGNYIWVCISDQKMKH